MASGFTYMHADIQLINLTEKIRKSLIESGSSGLNMMDALETTNKDSHGTLVQVHPFIRFMIKYIII